MTCPREKREEAEKYLIGEYGVRSRDSKGRLLDEAPCDIRTCFQRDIDRITHSKSFRRLKHKTQVFLQPEGDHYRTRLTHTLEVSRIARTISRALELNEDLTEAIALGHDLGHTPFGHAGERALNMIMADDGGFKHYEQSLRVVDKLERDGRGLNLCYETRMGIKCHTNGGPEESLEAVAVRLSDRIAYINHDVDDAIRAGVITETDIPGIVGERLGDRHSTRINSILTDIISNSSCGKIKMSPGIEEAVGTFHSFMYSDVYENPKAKDEEKKVPDILKGIFRHYKDHPDKLPDEYKIIAGEDGLERAICDYISGMTDNYAMYVYSELFIPAAWTVR